MNESGKKIVVTMDEHTCAFCVARDGSDPEKVGYPPYHCYPYQGELERESDLGCRCIVVDEKVEAFMRMAGRHFVQGAAVCFFITIGLLLMFAGFTWLVYCANQWLAWLGVA